MRDRIVLGMSEAKFSLLNAGDIAAHAGVAESSVRRHLPELIRDGLVQHTSYVGCYAISGPGRNRANEMRARRGEAVA